MGREGALVVLVALAVAAVVCAVQRSLLAVGAVLVLAVLWVLVDGPVEGPVLVRVTSGHGLTVADLASAAALVVAALALRARRRTGRGRRPAG